MNREQIEQELINQQNKRFKRFCKENGLLPGDSIREGIEDIIHCRETISQ
jgi:hypothetical protein